MNQYDEVEMTFLKCSILGFNIFVNRQFLEGILAVEMSINGWIYTNQILRSIIWKALIGPLGHLGVKNVSN